MGHIGFRYQGYTRCDQIQDVTEEFDDLMGLVQMYTACPRLCPEIGNRVQPNNVCTVSHIQKQDLNDFHQNVRICKIEIDLIFRKGGPDEYGAVDGLKFRE